MKKSGNRNGRRKYERGKTHRRRSERWNRQGGNNDEKADNQRHRLSVRGCVWKCFGSRGEFHIFHIESQTEKEREQQQQAFEQPQAWHRTDSTILSSFERVIDAIDSASTAASTQTLAVQTTVPGKSAALKRIDSQCREHTKLKIYQLIFEAEYNHTCFQISIIILELFYVVEITVLADHCSNDSTFSISLSYRNFSSGCPLLLVLQTALSFAHMHTDFHYDTSDTQ